VAAVAGVPVAPWDGKEAPVTGPVTTVLVVADVQPAIESKTPAPTAIAHAAILDLPCMFANAS